MKKRKIYYVTGTRAEYGLMRHSLKEFAKEFDLSLIVTGMHLSKNFGYTINEIEKDGFKICCRLPTLSEDDTTVAMAKTLGLTIIGITKCLEKAKPDILLLLGDRGEMLAATFAAAHLNIPIAHIHGGDQGDNGAHIDDQIRHAITKFAHIHLPATPKSAERIIKMGEEPWRVHVVGTPGLDEIMAENFFSKEYLSQKYRIDLEQVLIVMIQHPTLTQVDKAGWQMHQTLEAIKKLKYQTIIIYPNSDPGSRQMIKVLNQYQSLPFIKIYQSLPRKDYLSLLKYASVLIGNSSSGTIDSPAFKLPVVNIGIRETTREHAGNKIFVNNDTKKIIEAIKKALKNKNFLQKVKNCKNPYGDGKSTQRMIKILKNIEINDRLLVKKLTY